MSVFWDSLLQALSLLWHLNEYVFQVIGVSLEVSGSATLIGLVLGVPLGAFLGLTRFRGRNTLVALMNTGMGLPPVVVGLFVFMLFSRRGPLGFMDLLYTRSIMVVAEVIIATPYIVAITVVAIGSIPRDFRLQAFGLGASRLQGLWLVMREARVALMAAVIAGFGAIISEVGAVMIVGGNIATSESNETRMLTTAIVQETRMGHFDRAMALGLILLTMAFIFNLFLTRLQQGGGARWLQS